MKRNLLVGYGINIQFGGTAYGSEFILKRIKYNCRLGKYDSLFGGQITGKEIEIVFNAMMLDGIVGTDLVFKRVIQHCFYPSNFHFWRKTERPICSKFFSITL